MTENYVYLD